MSTDVILDSTTKFIDKLQLPKKYKVIVLNDDVTPMEFVIALLMGVFRHKQEPATEITMKIHKEGSAVAGIYSYEIAEQKTIESTNLARSNGFPLQIKLETE